MACIYGTPFSCSYTRIFVYVSASFLYAETEFLPILLGKKAQSDFIQGSSLLDIQLALALDFTEQIKNTYKKSYLSHPIKLLALCLGWITCWKLNLFHILKYSAASKSSRVDSPSGLCHFPFIVFSKLNNDFLLANLPILWCYHLSSVSLQLLLLQMASWLLLSLILCLGGRPGFARFGVVTQSFYFVFFFILKAWVIVC